MNYLSVCSGIEAATVAWHDMGWNPVGFSEIEKFPSQLLAHHYPNVTNYGDMTKFKEWNINDTVELLVGGTPCQSFSVAGLRKGLEDSRGNLMLTYLAMADHFKPKWLLWENVPGVLSSNRGSDFAALLQGLAELGYGFAYRVLDAQHFGVPQRRRRVFVIGCLGDWRSAAKVLFESQSLCRDITPSRDKREKTSDWPKKCASTLNASFGSKLGLENQHINSGAPLFVADVAPTITSSGAGWSRSGNSATEPDTYVAYALQGSMIGRQDHNGPQGDGINEDLSFTLNTTDRHAIAFKVRGGCEGGGKGYLGNNNTAFTLSTTQDQQIAIACDTYNGTIQGDVACTLTTASGISNASGPKAMQNMRVRRLTPTECERLQGFPDNYTNTPTSSDATRYKALGNSMAVPVMKWIGEKINEMEKMG
jgi:DNA (cytosine-5)-methyltransferase 1